MSWLPPDDDASLYDEYGQYADHRVRVRPNPKANRPRTKKRPSHEDAISGMVFGVDRGRYQVLINRAAKDIKIVATRARELHKTAIVIGDRVDVVGDISGDEGSLARIVRIAERKTLLRRSADDTDRVERVMVANADQMLIVVAAKNPEPRVRLVDRYLVAAYDAGIKPILCITKTDLASPDEFLSHFEGLELPVFLTTSEQFNGDSLSALRQALSGHETVFVGHSGVGKSTLINALVPEANRSTGDVNTVTGRGRHTSSSSIAFELTDDFDNHLGWVIDTPGVRSFGLGHVTEESIINGFEELHEIVANCPRGCTHLSSAPDCALDIALESTLESNPNDTVLASRVASLRRLLSVQE